MDYERAYTEICDAYVEDIFKAAKEYFCDGIYVKSDTHPCGWDFISFENLETTTDVMDLPIEVNDISGGCYDYHEYENKTLYEIIEMVGMNGWCFENIGVGGFI